MLAQLLTRTAVTRPSAPWGSRRARQVAALVGVVAAAGLAAGVWIPEPAEPAGWELNRGFESFAADFDCGFRADKSMQCRSGRSYRGRWLVALDGNFTECGILVDGRLTCWVPPSDRIGGPGGHPEPFPFGDERFTALSAGRFQCGIGEDRTLACTQDGFDPDDFPLMDPMMPPAGEFAAVSVGHDDACAIGVDRELVCWHESLGGGSEPLPAPPAGEFVSVSVGNWHACAVRAGGEVVCWGDDAYGQASPPAGSFSAVAVATYYSCGLRDDGEVACWGLRSGDTSNRQYAWNSYGGLWPSGPFQTLEISRLWPRICAVRAGSGEAVCWNDGTATHRPPEGAFVALEAGAWATCGLRAGGEVACWGHEWTWFPEEVHGRLTWEIPPGPFTALGVGHGHACGLRPGGEAVCWGRDFGGRTAAPPGAFTALSAYEHATCGLRPGGEAECWGARDADAEAPVAAPPPGPFTAIRVGHGSVCGLRPGGDMACWGTYSGEPIPAPDGAFTAVIAGDAYIPAGNCGLRTGGLIACAAADDDWTSHFPDWTWHILDGAFSTVSAWDNHFCGLRLDGEAVCWNASAATWHEPTPRGRSPASPPATGTPAGCALTAPPNAGPATGHPALCPPTRRAPDAADSAFASPMERTVRRRGVRR